MEDIGKLISDLGSDDQPTSFKAEQALLAISRSAKGDERSKFAQDLAKAIIVKDDPKKKNVSTARVRAKLTRMAGIVVGDAEVDILKEGLADLEIRDSVRMALQRIDSPKSTAALLLAATEGVGPEFRIGAVNALAKRNDPAVVAGLKKCLEDSSLPVRLAAVEALANQTDASADSAILASAGLSADKPISARDRLAFTKARLRLADNLVRAGQKEAGKKIYQSVLATDPESAQARVCEAALRLLG